MVDDKIGHHFDLFSESANVISSPQPRIDKGVVNRIEARVSAVDRMKER